MARARTLYREVLELDPDHVEARMALLRLDPIWEEAEWEDPRPPEERLELLEGLPEDDERVLVMQAMAWRRLGREREAREQLERVAADGHGPGTLAAVHQLWKIEVEERKRREE